MLELFPPSFLALGSNLRQEGGDRDQDGDEESGEDPGVVGHGQRDVVLALLQDPLLNGGHLGLGGQLKAVPLLLLKSEF